MPVTREQTGCAPTHTALISPAANKALTVQWPQFHCRCRNGRQQFFCWASVQIFAVVSAYERSGSSDAVGHSSGQDIPQFSEVKEFITIYTRVYPWSLSRNPPPRFCLARFFKNRYFSLSRCRDNAVGLATCYGLDGPSIESRCGRRFPHTSIPALGPTQSLMQWIPDLSRG